MKIELCMSKANIPAFDRDTHQPLSNSTPALGRVKNETYPRPSERRKFRGEALALLCHRRGRRGARVVTMSAVRFFDESRHFWPQQQNTDEIGTMPL